MLAFTSTYRIWWLVLFSLHNMYLTTRMTQQESRFFFASDRKGMALVSPLCWGGSMLVMSPGIEGRES